MAVAKTLKIQKALHHWMIKHKKTVALAESCTGGSIASKLTSISGASNYFLGSIVCYSNLWKENFLDVSKKTLKKYGAISSETCKEMVIGILKTSKADFGLAITGVAGPTSDEGKKIGIIWIGICQKGKSPQIFNLLLKGNRKKIIDQAANKCIELLYDSIEMSSKLKYSET